LPPDFDSSLGDTSGKSNSAATIGLVERCSRTHPGLVGFQTDHLFRNNKTSAMQIPILRLVILVGDDADAGIKFVGLSGRQVVQVSERGSSNAPREFAG
jgi:hypothetical protein